MNLAQSMDGLQNSLLGLWQIQTELWDLMQVTSNADEGLFVLAGFLK
jgi:hypothetical protein